MKRLVIGLAALPFLAAVASAQPMQLSENQMDNVTAGWSMTETDLSNTSLVLVAVYQTPHNAIGCTGCFLNVSTPSISIASAFLGAL